MAIKDYCLLCGGDLHPVDWGTQCAKCGTKMTMDAQATFAAKIGQCADELGMNASRIQALEDRLATVNEQYAKLQDRVSALAGENKRLRSLTKVQDALMLAYLRERVVR